MTNVTDAPGQSPSAADQVKERVQDVAGQATGQTREQLRSQVDTRSTQAGEQVSSTAKAMRRTSEQLRNDGKGGPARVVDGVADRSERLGSYLTEADGDRILRDVEDFARRQPWLFVGGSAIVGFLASRFMKASSSSRYRGGPGPSGGYPGRSGSYGVPAAGYGSAAVPSPSPALEGREQPRPYGEAGGGSAATGGGSGGLD